MKEFLSQLRLENGRLLLEVQNLESTIEQEQNSLNAQLAELEQKMKDVSDRRVSFDVRIIPVDDLKDQKLYRKGTYKDTLEAKLHGRKVAVDQHRMELSKHFSKEVRVLYVTSRHPNIVHMEGITDQNWLVTEFCPNTLETLERPLNLVRKLSIAIEICRGLSFLHRMGIVHGDLKPENVLISRHNVAKLSNFGLSYSAFSSVSRVASTTKFKPPESSLKKKEQSKIDPRLGDVFSLGCVLLFLFSGKLPWSELDEIAITSGMNKARQERKDFLPDELNLIQSESKDDPLMEGVCRSIARCFSVNPDSRGSSRKILSEFEALMDVGVKKKGAESEMTKQLYTVAQGLDVKLGSLQDLIQHLILAGVSK
eukprot:TRINITY_DN5847_c0_g1_i3.p1 TRINITY_DN5847_c0_g1~~TRINITY_DN5847_c0_g1_i3.p1  ORF type:complete len:368 (+),score=90.68 TRINITY_DN5847_c0_g1_i3:1145-2248(+)